MRLLAVMFNSTHSVLTSSGLLLFICATSTSVGLCVKKKTEWLLLKLRNSSLFTNALSSNGEGTTGFPTDGSQSKFSMVSRQHSIKL